MSRRMQRCIHIQHPNPAIDQRFNQKYLRFAMYFQDCVRGSDSSEVVKRNKNQFEELRVDGLTKKRRRRTTRLYRTVKIFVILTLLRAALSHRHVITTVFLFSSSFLLDFARQKEIDMMYTVHRRIMYLRICMV